MNRFYVVITSLFIILLTTSSCNNNKNVLSQDKMQKVLHDIELAEALFEVKSNEFITQEKKDNLINSVFKKHGITEEQYETSLSWYSDNIELYMKINDSIIADFRREISSMEQGIYKQNQEKSTYTIADIPKSAILSEHSPVLSFTVDSLHAINYSSTMHQIDFKTLGASQKTLGEFGIYYIYADTTIVYKTPLQNHVSYTMDVNINQSLKKIKGYFYVKPSLIQNGKIIIKDIKIN